jgi:hypothetical protein
MPALISFFNFTLLNKETAMSLCNNNMKKEIASYLVVMVLPIIASVVYSVIFFPFNCYILDYYCSVCKYNLPCGPLKGTNEVFLFENSNDFFLGPLSLC